MSTAKTIAVDGPAGSGKSTIAQRIADLLGYLYFDTGVMYRAVTLAALHQGVEIADEEGVTRIAHNISIDIQPPTEADGRAYTVILDAQDVTWQIRSSQVEDHVSQVSMYPGVRAAMTSRQREIGLRGNVVMAGRDIGTIVLPEADLKIYLDATVTERAWRRYQESRSRMEDISYADILASMKERDRLDSTRDHAPLRAAQDAVIIDTTGMTIDEGVEMVYNLAQGLSSEN